MLSRVVEALDRPAKRAPHPAGPEAREAAVAAVLHGLEPTDLTLLFIRRATVAGDPWSGDVAFPGGRREAADGSLLETAIRETREELGLDLSVARYLGSLDDVGPVSRRRPMVVQPHVFYLRELPALSPNREVAGVHRLSLDKLLANEGRGPMPFEWNGQSTVSYTHLTLPTILRV